VDRIVDIVGCEFGAPAHTDSPWKDGAYGGNPVNPSVD
jgi:hypothetical protein